MLQLQGDQVTGFQEKPPGDGGAWINGGFFVLEPGVLDHIEDDSTPWEGEPLMALASLGELHAYEHRGFWQPMDTMRDKNQLEALWQSGTAPWKVW
jgi:glucose-1-phosphate cytidylyltransferase